MLSRARSALCALSVVILVALLPAGAAVADTVDPATAPGVRLLHYNACGAKCSFPGMTVGDWADSIEHAMDYWNADAIMLIELCYEQYAELRNQLAARSGTKYSPAWYATAGSIGNCTSRWGGTDQRFGMAIFAKGTASAIPGRVTATLTTDPNDPNGNVRGLLCAKPVIDGKTTLTCVTHLTHTSAQYRDVQGGEVRGYIDGWAGSLPVVLGGDFNALPTAAELNHFYGYQGGSGRFSEVDEADKSWFGTTCPQTATACRSGEPTFDPAKKIDYIFISTAHFKTPLGDAAARSDEGSDHSLVRGAAAWR